jgi:hypothetical protein
MFAATLSAFWPALVEEDTTTKPPERRPAPIFIGDAVQPFGTETLLLSILRRDCDDTDTD